MHVCVCVAASAGYQCAHTLGSAANGESHLMKRTVLAAQPFLAELADKLAVSMILN